MGTRMGLAYNKRSITLETAERMIEAAVKKAHELGIAQVVTVLDESGLLKAFRRMDGAPVIGIESARRKAYTALLGVPSHEFHRLLPRDDSAPADTISTIPGITVFGGGLPIRDGAHIIGAIGVSGGSVQNDLACAEAAIKVRSSPGRTRRMVKLV